MANTNIPQLPIALTVDSTYWVPVQTDAGTMERARATTIAATASGFVPDSAQVNAGVGISGGGLLTSNPTLNFAPVTLAPNTAMVIADGFPISVAASAGAPQLVTFPNAMKALTGLTTLSIPSLTNDFLIINHAADGLTYKISPSALGLAAGNVPAGGTTGQVLAKASNANYDTDWINNSLTLDAYSISANPTGATANSISLTGVADTIVRIGSSGAELSFGAIDLSKSAAVGSSILGVVNGGTGIATTTAYALIAAGTTATGPFQQVSGLGTTNQVLASNGAGALPSWKDATTALGAALTRVDDTNVTLTLGGSPSNALLAATSITAGWTGQLALARGGTNANLTASNGGIFYSTATAGAILSGTATANQVLLSGSSAAPAWSTATYPATTTINQLLYSSSANVIAGLATVNGGLLNAGATGIPALTVTPVLGVAGTSTGTIGLSGSTSGVVTIQPQAAAGTFNFNLPTTAGTSGYVLTSAGGGASPMTWTAPGSLAVALVVGSTAISSGTTTRVLYDNAGVLGEYAQVPLAVGGTNAALTASNGGIFYSTASAGAILAGTATAGQIIRSGSSAAPSWSTSVYPATSAAGTILASLSANTITASATPTLGIAGTTLGTLALCGNTSGTITIQPQAAAGTYNFNLPTGAGTAGQPLLSGGGSGAAQTYGTLGVAAGGTANTTFTAYAVLCAGTTATGAFQNVSGVGTTNQVLASNGAAALPSWKDATTALGAALTRVDDTNVTLTLGGAPTTALLSATSITAGWTGQLSLARGGTNASLTASNGGIVYSTASALAILSGTATANQIILSGSSTTPSWSTATYPATASAGTVLAAGSANTISATVSPTLGVQQTTRGSLILANTAAGAFPCTLRSSNSATAATTIEFPVDAGTNGYVLSTNGSGVTSWIAVGGTGTVTSITPGSGLVSGITSGNTQTAITAAGTLYGSCVVNAQTGTTYTVLDTDRTKLVTHTNGSPIAVTLPQAGASSEFQSGWFYRTQNRGAGLVTITPTTSTIDGAASLTIPTGQGCVIVSDGTNYFTERGRPTGVLVSQGGTGLATLTSNTVYKGNGTSAMATSTIVDDGTTVTTTLPGVSPNWAAGYTTTATAAGTTTLTVASTRFQYFTGSTTQTVTLPVTSTLFTGLTYTIVNNSTGVVTVQSSGANNVLVMGPQSTADIVCILTSGTSAASWSVRSQYANIPQNSQSTAYTTVLSDAGKHLLHPTADNNARTFTIDSNANVPYPIGTSITFVNQINTLQIAITADTLTLAGAGTTGTRTLAASGIATALKIASTSWIISGVGLS